MVCVSGRSVFFENQFYFYFELEYSKIHFFQNRDLTWYATCSKMIVTNKQECLLCFNGNVSNRNVVDNGLYYLNMHFLPNRWNRWEETHKMKIFEFFFSEKPSCEFLVLVMNLHAKNQENRWSRFWDKMITNYY
jgi:hypothetical protein